MPGRAVGMNARQEMPLPQTHNRVGPVATRGGPLSRLVGCPSGADGERAIADLAARPRCCSSLLVAQAMTPEAALKSIGVNVAKAQRQAKAEQVNSFARADEGCDVVAHARERIAAALPGVVLVVAGDEVFADVADREFSKILGDAQSAHQRASGASQIVQTEVDARGLSHLGDQF